jgi:hypothetical protein
LAALFRLSSSSYTCRAEPAALIFDFSYHLSSIFRHRWWLSLIQWRLDLGVFELVRLPTCLALTHYPSLARPSGPHRSRPESPTERGCLSSSFVAPTISIRALDETRRAPCPSRRQSILIVSIFHDSASRNRRPSVPRILHWAHGLSPPAIADVVKQVLRSSCCQPCPPLGQRPHILVDTQPFSSSLKCLIVYHRRHGGLLQ